MKGQGSSELHVSGLITAIMNEFMTVPSSRSQGKHRSSLTTMAIMSFPINTPTTNLCDCHILCLFILKKRLICLDRILPSCIHCIVHDESRITSFHTEAVQTPAVPQSTTHCAKFLLMYIMASHRLEDYALFSSTFVSYFGWNDVYTPSRENLLYIINCTLLSFCSVLSKT